MTKIRLPYIHEFVDRYGKLRRYVRAPNRKRTPLPGIPGSDEFMAAYQAALAGQEQPKPKVTPEVVGEGTVYAAVASYLASTAYSGKADKTRRARRRQLEKFRVEHGHRRIHQLTHEYVERLIAKRLKESGRFAARDFFYALRVLVKHCKSIKMIAVDPTIGIELPSTKTDGWKTWDETNICLFEEHHPVGTMARLAFALLLYTVQRRSDVLTLGWQHVRNGRIYVKPTKTKNSTGVTLAIPLHPELVRVLSETPRGNMTFLVTGRDSPFSESHFSHWFKAQIAAAGCAPGLSAHGLRKAGLRRLAEAGASAKLMQALSGHATLAQLQHYIDAADQETMAEQAINLMATAFPNRTRT